MRKIQRMRKATARDQTPDEVAGIEVEATKVKGERKIRMIARQTEYEVSGE